MACLSDSRTSCRYEAVTLPEKSINMVVEQPMFFSETDGARFRGMVILVTSVFQKRNFICIQYGSYLE